jgi:thioredoxin-related protein
MSPVLRRIEAAANVGIIVVAIVVCAAAVKYFRAKPSSSQTQTPAIAAGTRINLRSEDWARNRQTLLLALSTNCKYCSASAEFYQRLVKNASSNTKLVAVLPQPREEAQQYLAGLKLVIDDIQQISPPSLGVRATPTLILVDNAGGVTKSWVGQLPHEKEEEVLSAIR